VTHWDGCWDAGPRHYECAVTRIRALREFIEYYALCPCCQQMTFCATDCTFENDAPLDHETMMLARAALEGKP